MRNRALILGSLLVGCLTFACQLPTTKNEGDKGGGQSEDGGSDGSTADGAGGGGDAGGGEGGGAITSCTDATLFSGNPYFKGELGGWNPAGQERLADPPLRHEYLAVSGKTVFIDTEDETWRTEGTKVVRVAGDEEEAETQYSPSGACKDARYIFARGIAALPNGNVIVADFVGGGLVELRNPTGDCTAAPYAGNQKKTLKADVPNDDTVANKGNVDGPGATAKFFGVKLPAADADGNVYVVDEGNRAIRKIAGDAAHTVSTLYKFPSDKAPNPMAMTATKGKLYVAGVLGLGLADFLWEIDTSSGASKALYEKSDVYEEVFGTAIISSMTHDDQALFVGSSQGYIWRIGFDGKVIATLAGKGQIVDFPEDLDLKKPIPVKDLPLRAMGTGKGSLVKYGNDLLWAGANGVGMHVFDIRCQ